mgnify:CR=1 FL=1
MARTTPVLVRHAAGLARGDDLREIRGIAYRQKSVSTALLRRLLDDLNDVQKWRATELKKQHERYVKRLADKDFAIVELRAIAQRSIEDGEE